MRDGCLLRDGYPPPELFAAIRLSCAELVRLEFVLWLELKVVSPVNLLVCVFVCFR